MRHNAVSHPLATLVVAMLLAGSASAQPLAEHVPADALLYVAWAGTEPLGEAYAQSHLAAALKSTADADPFTQSAARLLQHIGGQADDPTLTALAAQLDALPAALWHRPWVFSVHPPANAAADLRLQLLCEPGEHRAALHDWLTRTIEDAADDRSLSGARLVKRGDVLGLAVGTFADEPSLRDAAAFREMLALASFEPAFVAYADFRALQQSLDAVHALPGEAVDPHWHAVIELSGIDGLRRAIYLAGFDQRSWQARWLLEVPAPRQGWLAMLDAPPLDEALLAQVPRDAPWFRVARLDVPLLVQIMPSVLDGTGILPPAGLDAVLDDYGAQVDVDLQDELLAPLGSTWLLYGDPDAAGAMTGLCIVNPLRDPAAGDAVLDRLVRVVNLALRDWGWQLERDDQQGLPLYTLRLPTAAPSVTVIEGHLYIAMSPHTLVSAHRHLTQRGPSVLDQPAYRQLRQRLGDAQPWSIQFADLRRSADAAYHTHLMLWHMLIGFAVVLDEQERPGMWLPAPERLRPQLAAAGAVTWVDERGLHGRSHSPFPGSGAWSEDFFFSYVGRKIVIQLMDPATRAARASARSMQAQTQARGIQQNQVIFAQRHDGQFSNDIAELHEANQLATDYLLAPGQALPEGYDDWPRERQRRWLRAQAAFVLVPDLTDDFDGEKIAVFMRPTHAPAQGMAVVYNDGTTVWRYDIDTIDRTLREQTGMTMQQLLERQQDYQPDDEGDQP